MRTLTAVGAARVGAARVGAARVGAARATPREVAARATPREVVARALAPCYVTDAGRRAAPIPGEYVAGSASQFTTRSTIMKREILDGKSGGAPSWTVGKHMGRRKKGVSSRA